MTWNWILLAGSVVILILGVVNNVQVQMVSGTFLLLTAIWGLWAESKQKNQEEKVDREKSDDPPG